MLGDRLLASNAYDDCSKNDTKLKGLFQSTSFWNTTCTSDIDGAPGLSSGVFDGKHLSYFSVADCAKIFSRYTVASLFVFMH